MSDEPRGFFDATCPKCQTRIGWCGTASERPKCHRCGHLPATAKSDAEHIAELHRLLSLRASDAAGDDLRKLRKAAGLNLVQIEKLSGYRMVDISDWEHGRATPTLEQAEKLVSLYGGDKEKA